MSCRKNCHCRSCNFDRLMKRIGAKPVKFTDEQKAEFERLHEEAMRIMREDAVARSKAAAENWWKPLFGRIEVPTP